MSARAGSGDVARMVVAVMAVRVVVKLVSADLESGRVGKW